VPTVPGLSAKPNLDLGLLFALLHALHGHRAELIAIAKHKVHQSAHGGIIMAVPEWLERSI
jgi:hypothetical protein